jgi:lipoprotein-releasing system ATP-binding protein
MLNVDNVTKSYPTPRGELSILNGISLSLKRGDAAAIMGPSGSGKSTLLYLIGALERPSSGRVTLDGADPYALGEREQAAFRNRHIGFIFQDHSLLPQCSVLENVLTPTLAAPAREPAAAAQDDEARARTLLEQVGLGQRLDHRPGELSGGEKQRAAVARALIRNPTLVLCDEPTGNLDRASADAVASLLLDLHSARQTILVVVTHSAALAGRFPSRYEMSDGQLSPSTRSVRRGPVEGR